MEANNFFDKEDLLKLARWNMPFGKYKDRPLIDLPEAYLLWFREKGFPDGLPTEARKEFEEVYATKRKTESSVDATNYAIGHLVGQGIVPDVKEAIQEAKRVAGGKFYGGGTGKSVSDLRDQKEIEAYNQELAKHGISPAPAKSYKAVKEQGLI